MVQYIYPLGRWNLPPGVNLPHVKNHCPTTIMCTYLCVFIHDIIIFIYALITHSGIGGGGASEYPKFWFVENLGKISENPG